MFAAQQNISASLTWRTQEAFANREKRLMKTVTSAFLACSVLWLLDHQYFYGTYFRAARSVALLVFQMF
jgi:hypothetical protein